MRELNYRAATDCGRRRENNEDCLLSLPERGLWLVADGMGGHEAGEVASAIVAQSIENSADAVEEALQQAHQNILEASRNGIGAEGMGSTAVLLTSQNHDYQISWVGDSRAYLWSSQDDGGELQMLSTDHSYVQMLLETGAITEEELPNHPDRNIITQCLGSVELDQVRVDSVRGVWEPQQWILLCSDGLTDELSDQEIATILCNSNNPVNAVNQLIDAALNAGGRDNISVQIVESPLNRQSLSAKLEQWLPALTGNIWIDAAVATTALASVIFMLSWFYSA